MEQMKVLITVKTYPIPSARYDELVCTAGVTEDGSFVRLYPVNFRELRPNQRYRKYQWIGVKAQKHRGRDGRKESYRPDTGSIKLMGEPIPSKGNWSQRAKFVLRKKSLSMEHLKEQQNRDRTSLGIFKPKRINDLVIKPDTADWKPKFKAELAQARLWDDRGVTKNPPRKVPFKFQYLFECDDSRCKKNHRMMIEDWEVGALYWKLVDQGVSATEASESVRLKFLETVCAPDRDTHFYVGTILEYPKSWVVIGVYWPKVKRETKTDISPTLFD